ncbi:uncharacterized protein BJ171DRAFT_157827 [Polychytrium aggregatum]|uniref:uncharacterized protein n=1 Tax=Polychytrium aggregatum TaxID=110093 RepID=UPI0022FE2D90|nr:uncharacterized protein BJ171DRAFT_157827 [Polychytrium aggregatum]KAI9203001.1 hypothetical protein BJ171DRAFT_157827 [Polychytrium aggregatum]
MSDQLQQEIKLLNEQNQQLQQELAQLQKEKQQWRQAHAQAEDLEALADQLHQESSSLEGEAARLRKLNAELERVLTRERAEHAEERNKWSEKESELQKAAREHYRKLKEMREALAVHEKLASVATKEAPAPVANNKLNVSVFELQQENSKQRLTIEELTYRLQTREYQLRRQDEEIAQLQQTVSALMDELESRDEHAQHSDTSFEGGIDLDAELNHGTYIRSPPKSIPGSPNMGSASPPLPSVSNFPSQRPDIPTDAKVLYDEQNPSLGNLADELARFDSQFEASSFGTIADELGRLGEKAPTTGLQPPSPTQDIHLLGDGTLKSRLAALGLNTEGNRKILRKRLERYIKKKAQKSKVVPTA